MNTKTKTIVLNGVEVVLYERTVAQTIALADYSASIQADTDESAFVLKSICMLIQSLDYNKRDLVKPSFLDKLLKTKVLLDYERDTEWNEQFTFVNVAGSLSKQEVFKFCAMLQEIEGDDNTYYRLRGNELTSAEANALVEQLKKKSISQ